MAQATAHPVQSLREHAKALEAAISVCLAAPKRGRVHEVRKACRKVEASISLIGRLPGMPAHQAQAERVLQHLHRLRRAAGRVRDLDVQRELLKEDVLRTKRVGGGDVKVRNAAKKLRRLGRQRRKLAADQLLHGLRKRQGRAAGSLEDLLAALEKAESIAVPPGRLLERVEQIFDGSQHQNATAGAEGLHDTRKRAKQARYQAELVVGSSRAAKTVQDHFEQLQESGGAWHDWLQLAELARKRLGKRHPATRAFAEERDRKLERYRQLLG